LGRRHRGLVLLLGMVLGMLLLGVLRMLRVLLWVLLRVLLWVLLGMLLGMLSVLLRMGSWRMCRLLRRRRALSRSRGRRRGGCGRRLLLLLRLRRRLRLLGMSHGRLDWSRMMLRLAGLGRRRGAIRGEMPLFLLPPCHVWLGIMGGAVPVGMVSELCLRLLLLLRRCRLLLQRWHRRRLLLTLPCLHVASPRSLLHRR
jgi:hypothetical protein